MKPFERCLFTYIRPTSVEMVSIDQTSKVDDFKFCQIMSWYFNTILTSTAEFLHFYI